MATTCFGPGAAQGCTTLRAPVPHHNPLNCPAHTAPVGQRRGHPHIDSLPRPFPTPSSHTFLRLLHTHLPCHSHTKPPLDPGPGGGGGWHKASALGCLPLAAPIGLSPLLIPTLCGPERVVSTEPPDNLFDYSGGRPSRRRAVARAVEQMHPDAHPESMRSLPTPALTCARWRVGWHVALVYCSQLQLAGPIGRSPFAALPLDPFPPQAVVPIGLSLPCVLPLPPCPIFPSLGGGGGGI